MLLEARRSLRFTKLEKRSPTMAKVATRVPIFHPRPNNTAQIEVANKDTTTPRIVFEGPKMGSPSTKRAPPSSGRPNAGPRSFLATTAVPLATTSRISNCSNNEPCINGAHGYHLKPKFIGGELPCGYGGGGLLDNLSAVGTKRATCFARFGVGNDPNRTLFTLTAEAEARRPDDRLIESLLWKIGYRYEVANSIN